MIVVQLRGINIIVANNPTTSSMTIRWSSCCQDDGKLLILQYPSRVTIVVMLTKAHPVSTPVYCHIRMSRKVPTALPQVPGAKGAKPEPKADAIVT